MCLTIVGEIDYSKIPSIPMSNLRRCLYCGNILSRYNWSDTCFKHTNEGKPIYEWLNKKTVSLCSSRPDYGLKTECEYQGIDGDGIDDAWT